MKRVWASRVALIGVLTAMLYITCCLTKGHLQHTAVILSDPPCTIVIDPGHGGEDGGALSRTGVPESRINLEIAKKLNLLLRFCGFRTFMTRTEDVSLHRAECHTILEKKRSDLKTRVSMVQAVQPAILISIHQNHFSDSRYHGAQVFYADTLESKLLAQMTQANLQETLDPDNHRKIQKTESVYLMEHIHCPGILIECGFLSHPEEELLLQDAQYQKKITCAIGCGLAQFMQERETYGEV